MFTSDQDLVQALFDEALAWPSTGECQSKWHDWVRRAREVVKGADGVGRHYALLSCFVVAEQDGLSLAQWESFLFDVRQLKAAKHAWHAASSIR